jgi:hypothetical protein
VCCHVSQSLLDGEDDLEIQFKQQVHQHLVWFMLSLLLWPASTQQYNQNFLGTFAKVQKAAICLVMSSLSVHPFVTTEQLGSLGRIFMKFDI